MGVKNIIVTFADFITYKISPEGWSLYKTWRNTTSLRPYFGPLVEWFSLNCLLWGRSMTILGVKLRKELDHIQFSFFLSLFGLFSAKKQETLCASCFQKVNTLGSVPWSAFWKCFWLILFFFFLSTYLRKVIRLEFWVNTCYSLGSDISCLSTSFLFHSVNCQYCLDLSWILSSLE